MTAILNFKTLALAVAFSAGWMIKGWQVDSIKLAAEIAADKVAEENTKREADIVSEMTTLLQETTLRERIIERQMQPIIQREVYTTDCIDDDGLNIINGLPIDAD